MPPSTKHEATAWLLAALALLAVLKLKLLPALFAGLLVFELVHALAPKLKRGGRKKRLIVVFLLAVGVVSALTLLTLGAIAFFRSEAGSLPVLLRKMAEILEGSRAMLPAWAAEYLPSDMEKMKDAMAQWLREHAGELRLAGEEAGRALVHALFGMIIGAMVSLREPGGALRPLAQVLAERLSLLGDAFQRVVFAQVRISALNTAFTSIYLVVVLPLSGIHLPFAKTLIAVTFIAGLLPVIGNLISNSVIVVISLSQSLYIALASLAFLVAIHKLEYFLNARIIGSRIRARAWELLTAMLVMEAAFGLAGVVAAPVYYAYLKAELDQHSLV